MELVRGFGKDLSGLLFQELGISGPDADKRCCEYLSQPTDITIKRGELQDKLRRLERAKDAIEDWRLNRSSGLPVGNERPFALETPTI